MKSKYIWMDGELVPFQDAKVHVLSPSLHYGPSVFEGIRCYASDFGPAVFRLREHIERFIRSCRILGMDLQYTVEELIKAVTDTVQANGFASCYIRPLMFLEGPLGLNLQDYTPRVSIATWEWATFLGEEALEKGAHLMVSSFTRMHPNASMTKAKIGGQYVNSILAKSLAVASGFNEAILLDPEGFVAECSGENIFLVRDGVVFTPPKAAILEGITRDSVIQLAGDLGYDVREEKISRDQVYIADEIFICGTAAEVTPVSRVDHRKIGSGTRGPVTEAVQQAFFETVQGRGKRSEEWLDWSWSTDAVEVPISTVNHR